MKPQAAAAQVYLSRPVCAAVNRDQVCTLLAGHPGHHISSKGRDWK